MLIDLSVTLNTNTPVYPGDPAIELEPAGMLERDGWNDHRVALSTHIGTHIDAPLHMLKDGANLGEIPLEQFVGRGTLIEVKNEFRVEDLEKAGIQPGDIVLFCTGMSSRYHDPEYFEKYPVMPQAVADYLVAHKVKMVGVDTGSVDSAEDFPIHKTLLAGGVLVAENLTNLAALQGKAFTVYALPIKLDVDGAPARIIAHCA